MINTNNAAERSADEVLSTVVQRLADYMLSTCDPTRRDRLFPAYYAVFATNPLSIAYGACGVALFLHRVRGIVPDSVRQWMLAQPLSTSGYPPGLHVGLAGVAYAFAELGWMNKAEEAMRAAYTSHLLYDEPGMCLGVAGWGSVSLYLWGRTGNQTYFDYAVQAGDHLLATANPQAEGCCWSYNLEQKVHFGYGYGASGIGLFLLQLGAQTGKDQFTECAVRGLDYDLANRIDTIHGVSWKRDADDMRTLPYWLHGASGIGTVALRFHRHVRDHRYLSVAREIAEAVNMKWTIHPGQTEGLSGIGDFMLDMHRFVGEEEYHRRARDMADTVLWFAMESPNGLAFPGRFLMRICNDFSTGGAGIGMFLHRLLRPGPRVLVDFDGSLEDRSVGVAPPLNGETETRLTPAEMSV